MFQMLLPSRSTKSAGRLTPQTKAAIQVDRIDNQKHTHDFLEEFVIGVGIDEDKLKTIV